MSNVNLVPEEGIAILAGEPTVISLPAWYRVAPTEAISRHRWICIRYSTGLFDPLTRPIIRFTAKSGRIHYGFMNAAILGTAEWIGRVPKNTVSVSISPTESLGPFSFRIDEIEAVNRTKLLARGFAAYPTRTYFALQKRLTNSRQSAWDLLKSVSTSTTLSRYQDWMKRLQRLADLRGFDQPRCDWSRGPEFVLFASLAGTRADDFRLTLSSLQSQLYPRWRLYALSSEDNRTKAAADFRQAAARDARLREFSQDDFYPDLFSGLTEGDFVASITFGDRLRDIALGSVAEVLARRPDVDYVYSDEDSFSGEVYHSPLLKPDWSPIFQQTSGYVGRLACMRYGAIKDGCPLVKLATDPEAVVSSALAQLRPSSVAHVRRPLYSRKRPVRSARAISGQGKSQAVPRPAKWPGVGIVIPTRDRPELLRTCLNGLKDRTDYPDFEVVIVDNETTDAEALSILSSIQVDPRFRVIQDPGAFNYSKHCNLAARNTQQPVLVFLNNDIDVFQPDWLKALVATVSLPGAGVVGARLFFPNGRLQHAGIVLGLGGIAGHPYMNASSAEAGYLSTLHSLHEISAVTGACCAVDRSKFLAVGGFDEVNLPIELNDIDLCLRIAEKGWCNYWTPESSLIHLQSASRGVADRPSDLYAREQAYFVERWAHVIRDDPYFHPALSLFSNRPALG